MVRCDTNFSITDIQKFASRLHPRMRPAQTEGLCEHGYTWEEGCFSCEGGYMTDVHVFADADVAIDCNGQKLLAVTDDNEEVFFIPDSWQEIIDRRNLALE